MAYQAGHETIKGERAVITVAGKEVEVFMLPNGTYAYTATSACKAIGKRDTDWVAYQRSIKGSTPTQGIAGSTDSTLGDFALSLVHKGSTPTQVEGVLVSIGRTRIKAVSDTQVAGYWAWKAKNGNVEAEALLSSLATEALNRRANVVFGVKVSEEQVEQRTATIRLNLIEQAKVEYLSGNKDKMYSTLSQAETEIGLLMVSIERLKAAVDDPDNWLMCHKDAKQLESTQARLNTLMVV